MRRPLTLLLAAILPTTLIAAVPPGPVGASQEVTPSAVSSLGREEVLATIDRRLSEVEPGAGARALLDILDATPGMDPLLVDEGGGEASGDVTAEPVSSMKVVGDLDGDRADDVIVAAWEPSDAGYVARLSARRGSDGSELWSVDRLEDEWHTWVPYAVGDLTGDGAPDLLELTVTWSTSESETCDDSGCVSTQQEHDELFWLLRSGADGTTTALSRSEGTVTWEGGWKSQQELLTKDSSSWERWEIDLPDWPVPIGDQDGDGAGDLLLSRVHARFDSRSDRRDELAGLSSRTSDAFGWTGRLDARIVRSDGSLIRDLSDTMPGFVGWWAQPMVAAGSEPAALLLAGWEEWGEERQCERALVSDWSCTSTEHGDASYRTVVLEPRSFEERFRVETPQWIAGDAIGDVTGDGVGDIATWWTVHSGADGQRWTPLDGREYLRVLRDGRDGPPVVLEVRQEQEATPCNEHSSVLVIDRIDGTTGDTIASSRQYQQPCDHPDPRWGWYSAGPVGDHDGDGVADVAIIHDFGPTRILSAIGNAVDVVVEGRPKYVWDDSSRDWTFTALRGDFDGDGRQDLVMHRPWTQSDEDDPGEAVVSMPSGTVLWEVGSDGSLLSVGDVDGDGTDDAVVRRSRRLDESRYEAWSEVVRGGDGSLIWRTSTAVFVYGEHVPWEPGQS